MHEIPESRFQGDTTSDTLLVQGRCVGREMQHIFCVNYFSEVRFCTA